ncbi:MAG: RNA polymerase sigma factor [Armatimonadetes bacterium]|nr:sigma-70 family RNA polymerase sigma factor [Armatimonadota bacterium]MBS1700262.1 RNA polymerase sigma factor [Armatimonadota bacterium]
MPPFEELIRTYGTELRRFVYLKVEAEAVEDVLQEVWVAAWQGYSGVQNPTTIRAWIYGICLHKCHDHYRDKARESSHVAIAGLEILDPGPSPEGLAVDSARVSALLKNLDDSQREVVELYYYAQLTLAEISELLKRNMNTVKYQFYRAHTTLLEVGRREELL